MRVAVVIWFVVLALSTSAEGQTSSQIAAGKPAETYLYFKLALARLRAGADAVAERATQPNGSLSLADCWGNGDYIGYDHQDSITENAATLAYDVLFMQAALEAAGYPKALWERDLSEYEQAYLENISNYDGRDPNQLKTRLAAKLNDYKKTSNGNYKSVAPDHEGCGGGEVPIIIRTIPRAQRVQYINLIKYELCLFQNLEPTGPLCDRWVDYDIAAKEGALMSGKYKIYVTWSDGSNTPRDLNVDDLFRGRNWDDPIPFTIRK
jgi:hypothetical protein